MTTPKSAVRDRSVSVLQSGDHYTVSDRLADEALIEIEALVDQVQFPNGLAYNTNETALLTVAEVDELDADGEGVVWQNNGVVSPVAAEGTPVSILVDGTDADDAIANAATNQYTATVTFASGDTLDYDETNSDGSGLVWSVLHVSGTAPVGTIDADGLFTAHAVNDGTVRIVATFKGLSGQSAVLTVA